LQREAKSLERLIPINRLVKEVLKKSRKDFLVDILNYDNLTQQPINNLIKKMAHFCYK
jgi:hypothetical protein